MKNDLEKLLQSALTLKEEPGEELNREIIKRLKEKKTGKSKKFRGTVAAAAVLFAAVSSLTVFAAWRYRSASQMAEELGDGELAIHFEEQVLENIQDNSGENGKEAGEKADIPIFEDAESQSFGGYKAVLLGMVSGEGLSEYERMAGGTIHGDRTYLAVAISREDGIPIDDEKEEFFVSPLIGSLDPKDYNALDWKSNYGQFVEDGTLYRLMECDNIEYFADQNLYVCVTDTAFYKKDLYQWDEANGKIIRNKEYEGLNALFELSVDPSKADPEKAGAFLERLEARGQNGEEDAVSEEDPYSMLPEKAKEAMAWGDQITPENIEQYCVRLEHTVQTKTPDEDGFVSFEWRIDTSIPDTAGSSSSFDVEWLFAEGEKTMSISYGCSEKGLESLTLDTFTLNEDGSVTFAVWVPKEGSMWLNLHSVN